MGRCALSGRTTTDPKRQLSARATLWSRAGPISPERPFARPSATAPNAQLVLHDAHLMLFDDADELAARLDDDTCALAAQDDSFFAYYFTQPGFAERFSQKFGFAQLPWGMAVARDASDRLPRALRLINQNLPRRGAVLR